MTSTEAALRLGTSSGQLSNAETGRFGVSGDRIRALADAYGCHDEPLIEALVSMAQERSRGWWEEYRGILPGPLLDLAELEHHSRRFRTAHTAHIPGLFQTAEHAREIYRQAVPAFSPPDVEQRISFRIKRQAVLFQDSPAPHTAIVHEAALRMKFGGPEVTRAQLQHLLTLSELKHVTLLVIPFHAGSYPGSGQTITYAHGPVTQLDTVQLDQSHGIAFVDTEHQLAQYRLLFGRLAASALTAARSRDFIRAVIHSL